jgi:predicted small lipoprotein YifL
VGRGTVLFSRCFVVLFLLMSLALGACGKKGPLYLPKATSASVSVSDTEPAYKK